MVDRARPPSGARWLTCMSIGAAMASARICLYQATAEAPENGGTGVGDVGEGR